MTTKATRPVTRETFALVRDKGLRAVIVTIVGSVIELRAKGLRSTETIDVAWCYRSAVQQRLFRQQSERRRQKGGRALRSARS